MSRHMCERAAAAKYFAAVHEGPSIARKGGMPLKSCCSDDSLRGLEFSGEVFESSASRSNSYPFVARIQPSLRQLDFRATSCWLGRCEATLALQNQRETLPRRLRGAVLPVTSGRSTQQHRTGWRARIAHRNCIQIQKQIARLQCKQASKAFVCSRDSITQLIQEPLTLPCSNWSSAPYVGAVYRQANGEMCYRGC